MKKRASSIATGTLLVALLVGGPGTTTAAWRDETVVDGGTLSTGALGVSVTKQDPASRKLTTQFGYTVSAEVVGDNLAAELRLGFDENPDPGGAEVATAAFIEVEGTGIQVDAHGGEIVVGVVPEGGSWAGDAGVPVLEADRDGAVHVPVTFTVVQVDRAAVPTFQFPGGTLVASIHQVRPAVVPMGTTSTLWSDQDSAEVPSIGSVSVSRLADGTATGEDPAPPATVAPSEPADAGDPDASPPASEEAAGVATEEADVEERAVEQHVFVEEIPAWQQRSTS